MANTMNPTKIQKSLAKYLYKNLEGAHSLKNTSTYAEVQCTILYQIPRLVVEKYGADGDFLGELDVNINITTYSDKIRVEVIEITPEEKTIAFKTFKEATFNNVQEGFKIVYDFITYCIEQEFEDYEILF